MSDVGQTTQERKSRYGDFRDQARIEQALMDVLMAEPGWQKLEPFMKSSLQMMCVKMARIVNGDPNYADNWHDIGGYAKIAEERLPGGGQ